MLLAGESLEALHEREEEALSNLSNESAAVFAFILFINHAENVKTREEAHLFLRMPTGVVVVVVG